MRKKAIGLLLIGAMIMTAVSGCAKTEDNTASVSGTEGSENMIETEQDDVLRFPIDDYTVETVMVVNTEGEVEVTYHYYQQITYVANPVDPDYQSMNVKVPVKINGVDIDAANAPILFANSVAGYMSSSNVNAGGNMGDEPNAENMPEVPGTPPPSDAPQGSNQGGPTGVTRDNGDRDSRKNLALAAGYVVVEPGTRGRDNQADDGTYYGKAPAAIVDLKAAVRYIRYNQDIMPGNSDWIISVGTSAGGALSALLGASGNSTLYEPYLKEIGAADAEDHIYASADFCPITDLEHADMAYEWMFGSVTKNGELLEQSVSAELAAGFAAYQASLNLQGLDDFGDLTADNYANYLITYYLIPSAEKYLSNLSEDALEAYLADNTWILWNGESAAFTFEDYLNHIGSRKKDIPAFDAFDLSSGENSLFGNEDTNTRHFTAYSAERTATDGSGLLDEDVLELIKLMNPMYFINEVNTTISNYWWIRHGTKDSDTSLPVIVNLGTSLENLGKDVSTILYWDAGHGADEDTEDFIQWIQEITGYE